MFRYGIIGTDSSHAAAFSKLINVDGILGKEGRVTAVWGEEEHRTHEVAEIGGIGEVVAQPADLLGNVDAVMVLARHGSLHAKLSLPFLEAGVAAFIDKPLAASVDDCRRMIAAARSSGAPLTSFSTLRFAPATEALLERVAGIGSVRAAHLAGPCDFESRYDGPYFYANHIVEVTLRLLGEDVQSVSATRSGRNVVAQLIFSDEEIATLAFLANATRQFHATAYGSEGIVAQEIGGGDDSYSQGMRIFHEMVKSRQGPLSAEQMMLPIAIIETMQQSLALGGSRLDRDALQTVGFSANGGAQKLVSRE